MVLVGAGVTAYSNGHLVQPEKIAEVPATARAHVSQFPQL